MTAITGGTHVDPAPDEVLGYQAGSTELRVLDAVVACAARWGIDKTTVDDVAREAGVSRATVYRLFPGGKPAMMRMATDREAVVLLGDAMERITARVSLADAIAEMICAGHDTLRSQTVLAFMREHEPAKLRLFFSFERMDSLLEIAADVVSPSLERYLSSEESRVVVIWVARLVVSHFVQPDASVDLSDPADARHLTESHILPGLRIQRALTSSQPSPPSRSSNDHQ